MAAPAPPCDVVVPVYNGLDHVCRCLAALREHTRAAHNVVLVDDASDAVTSAWLRDWAAAHDRAALLRNEANLGFVRTANRGLAQGRAPWVVLLNSDVVVTPGWLERLLAAAGTDPAIAAVNPMSNNAPQIETPLPPGANFLGVDRFLRERGPAEPVDVVTGVGFCLLLRRSALDQVGLLDEAFGRGYGEDSDLCMRLTAAGWRTVVAPNVYVYHQGGGSFADGGAAYRANRRIFDQRWAAEYGRQFAAFRRLDPLGPARRLVRGDARTVRDLRPHVVATRRSVGARLRAGSLPGALAEVLRGVKRLPAARRPAVDAGAVARLSRPGRLRVTYLLPDLLVAGGVLRVVDLVNRLIERGVEARIAALYMDPGLRPFTRLYTEPMLFAGPRELTASLPESDVVVATHWRTAPWAADLARSGRAGAAAYYLQDFEPWFHPEGSAERARALAGHELIGPKIATSRWLAGLLRRAGHEAAVIPCGLDPCLFYPRDPENETDETRVLAMARPGTPWRGFAELAPALVEVKRRAPGVRIALFGHNRLRSGQVGLDDYEDLGILFNPHALAREYSRSTLFMDASRFQGFGLCGLEAMACGCPAVLTDAGGVNEYARPGENCLTVPPRDPGALADAVLRMLEDDDLRRRCAEAGPATAKRFCPEEEARATHAFLHDLAR